MPTNAQPGDRLATLRGCPSELLVDIGNLQIRAGGNRPALTTLAACEILLNGKPITVKSIIIRGDVDEIWAVELEFYPEVSE